MTATPVPRTRCTKAMNGTSATRAEARRAQQRLAASEPERNFVIMDILGHVLS